MKLVLSLLLAAACGSTAHTTAAPSSHGGLVVDGVKNTAGPYRIGMTHEEAMKLPGAVENEGAINFDKDGVGLGFGSGATVCEIDVSAPGAATPEGPAIGQPVDAWSKVFGEAKEEAATGDTYFEHGHVTVSLDDGKVKSIRLGGCGE